jgi:hypothetical protein
MRENTANAWWASKKIWMTTIGQVGVAVCGSLALNDPNPNHLYIYLAIGAGFAVLSGNYVNREGKIDEAHAAAAKPAVPDTLVQQNNEAPRSPDEETDVAG